MNPHKLSKAFAGEVDCFLECADATQLNRILRCFLLAYLHRYKHGFPSFHESLICEIEILFYFIEEIGKEQSRRKQAKKPPPTQTTLVENSLAGTG
jgi:hypothetical protein